MAMEEDFTRLEYHNNAKNSHKFWQIKRVGSKVYTEWGRVGTTGQSQIKAFIEDAMAANHMLSMINKKQAKGYKKVVDGESYDEEEDLFDFDDEEEDWDEEEEKGFLESRREESKESKEKSRLEDLIL